MRVLLVALSLLALFSAPAEARHRHRQPVPQNNNFLLGIRSIKIEMHRETRVRPQKIRTSAIQTSHIVEHPAGCPARAFCGCGAAVRVFGAPIRSLWLAANWYRFQRTYPAPGMVAVRSHHVFVLEQHLGGDTWLAYDANSGHGATQIHARSISGYAIVNPRS